MRRLYVHIIESLSAGNLLNKMTEGALLKEGLRIAGIEHSYWSADNEARFGEAIDIDVVETPHILQFDVPIIHISAHGNKDGIQLTDGTYFQWNKLKNIFKRKNLDLNNLLIVCMSSCEGFGAVRMAFNSEALPFLALIGPTSEIDLRDRAMAFLTFYYRLNKDASPQVALDAMKISSGNDKFAMISGYNAQRIWQEAVNKFPR